MEKPYVISAELDLQASSKNSYINTGQLDSARTSLDADLRSFGKNTYWINSDLLAKGIAKEVRNSQLPVVCLDTTYFTESDGTLNISRGVNAQLQDAGYVPRQSQLQLNDQLDAVASLSSEIQLVDDVVFSGEMLQWISEALAQRNVKIGRVVCGISIGEGLQRLSNLNIDCFPVVFFDEVDDELCERDLFVSRGSGRRVQEQNANALYFDPVYGKPSQWASLPAEYADDFFRQSLERSLSIIQPDTEMSEIGNFVGYQTNGTVSEALRTRLQENI